MRIALFTSTHLRHRYVAAQIAASCNLQLIITETKSSRIEDKTIYNPIDQDLFREHFTNREITEAAYFGNFKNFPSTVPRVSFDNGKINGPKTVDLLEEHAIDGIVLFGTSIIKPFILDQFSSKVINLHLGVSPYYKGSGTNFFPIANGDFECLGATIHLATTQVDAGGILHQIRLENLTTRDTIHTLGNKIIKKAGSVLPTIINKYFEGKIKIVPQWECLNSKEYRLKDFTPETLRKAHQILQANGIAVYLNESLSRKQNKPIIDALNA